MRALREGPLTRSNTLTEARESFTRDYIVKMLEQHGWNMTRTAAHLGIYRPHLYWLMKRYAIVKPIRTS